MHKYLKSLWAHINPLLGTMSARLVALLIAVIAGVFLGKHFSPWFLALVPENVYGDIRTVVGAIPFTLPTFLALWWFRTYDSFQSNLRANFDSGVAHIASNEPIRIEIGTVILIKISETTSSYDREISTAFVRRLNQSPAEATANRKLLDTTTDWNYAQKMLLWLKHQNKKYDLYYVDLRNQDFFDETAGITLCDLFNMNTFGGLTIDVAGSGFSSWDEFFGCCAYAREKLETANRHFRMQNEGRLEAQLEPDYQPPTADELPSLIISVTCNYCGKNPKSSTNTNTTPDLPEQ